MDFQSTQDPKQRGILGKHKAYVFGRILERMGNGMTRKRFIKLCMSKGYSRNAAEKMRRDAIAGYGNYANGWEALRTVITISCSMHELNRALAAVGKAIETIGRKLREAVES